MASESRSTLKETIVRGITNELPPGSFQKRPYFPDLLRQPDLLIVPESGKLIAIFVYQFPRRMSWQATLASLEDLFEMKLNVGSHTVVCAIVASQTDHRDSGQDRLELLRNTFDRFVVLEAQNEPGVWEGLVAGINASVPKERLSAFLGFERERSQPFLRRFEEENYRDLTVRSNAPIFKSAELEDSVVENLSRLTKRRVVRHPRIRNVKGEIAHLPDRYYFEFDIGFEGRPDIAIEVIQAGKHGAREKLRSLMTKGRLLKYEVVDNQLQPRAWPLQLILIIDGNIAGPDHDPYRYVRSLLSVGWELLRVDRTGRFRELIGNENL
jgi:hypothetical protein